MDARFQITLPVLLVASITTAFGQTNEPPAASDIPVITVCEALHDLAKYNGRTIVIVGRYAATMEGTWLGQECEQKIETQGYAWDNMISTTYFPQMTKGPPPDLPKTFRWDENRLRARLREVQTATKLQDLLRSKFGDRWVAMFGRFETRVPPQVGKSPNGSIRGFGFGHLNAALAQLISPWNGFYELKAH